MAPKWHMQAWRVQAMWQRPRGQTLLARHAGSREAIDLGLEDGKPLLRLRWPSATLPPPRHASARARPTESLTS